MADSHINLESALAKLEADVEVTVKVAKSTLASLQKVMAAARTGDLRELRKSRESAEQALGVLQQQFANVREGWDIDEEAYLSGSDFIFELIETAKRADLKLHHQDGQLYCYPFLIRVLPAERVVTIDRVRERHIRPQVLVARLKGLQNRPVRFKPEAFLEALHEAYSVLVGKRDDELLSSPPVVRLIDLYELLTLLPGQAKEYPRQEFARDLYLLDQSGVTATKQSREMRLSASTGTKSSGSVLSVITKEGRDKKYYGISFETPQRS